MPVILDKSGELRRISKAAPRQRGWLQRHVTVDERAFDALIVYLQHAGVTVGEKMKVFPPSWIPLPPSRRKRDRERPTR